MAYIGEGVSSAIATSAISASASIVSGAATGTASTTWRAPCRRATRSAARAVPPVAMPSSTMITVRPASEVIGRAPRYRRTRRSSSTCSRASTAASCSAVTPPRRTTSGSRTRTPPSPIAPMPSSGCWGIPSLRTTITSRGACSARATSNATGTPPRGSASTTGCSARHGSSRVASARPASRRSRKRRAFVIAVPHATTSGAED